MDRRRKKPCYYFVFALFMFMKFIQTAMRFLLCICFFVLFNWILLAIRLMFWFHNNFRHFFYLVSSTLFHSLATFIWTWDFFFDEFLCLSMIKFFFLIHLGWKMCVFFLFDLGWFYKMTLGWLSYQIDNSCFILGVIIILIIKRLTFLCKQFSLKLK